MVVHTGAVVVIEASVAVHSPTRCRSGAGWAIVTG
jgi:hypothetical protein